MSGGTFGYHEYEIENIAETIQNVLDRQGKMKPKGYTFYDDDPCYETYPEEVLQHMRDAVKTLRRAYIYARRIDRLLTRDDSNESFLKTLEAQLADLDKD